MLAAIKGIGTAALTIVVVVVGFFWVFCRVDVAPDECLVLIRKIGDPLPAGETIASGQGQKGIQREAWGPGRYYFVPWMWETRKAPLTEISAGDPETWRIIYAAGRPDYEIPSLEGAWPEVGIVTSLAGKPWDGPGEVVDEGFQGVQRKVLTPGTYRLNPLAFKVERVPAIVVPLGCVGVVTSQLGEEAGVERIRETSIGPDGQIVEGPEKIVQKLATEGQRGVLEDVLPPGLYYVNPKVHQVKLVQIGYNQLTQLRGATDEIAFPAQDGFTIAVEVTVVWGRDPRHTPEMISRLGEVERIREIILGQTRSICRNIGSQYVSTDFIEGERRELYQQSVTETLRRVCSERNIEILIALIQNIEVRGGTAAEGLDLKQTIQRRYIAEEENLTTQKLQETARVKADLATKEAAIEVAREEVASETRKLVAEIAAEGRKRADEITAQRDLEVAQIDRQIAELDAQRTLALGQAEADVERFKRQAEADGKRLFVQAFGSGRAYNLYTFAENFAPESIRLIFAGEGTFWTDLSKMQDVASVELLRSRETRSNDGP